MLSVPSFRSTFVFSINLSILSGLPLTSLIQRKSHYLLFCGLFIRLCELLSKKITKCLLFIINHMFSTRFTISLFYFNNLKI